MKKTKRKNTRKETKQKEREKMAFCKCVKYFVDKTNERRILNGENA
jgi:hypothetical protein